MNINQVQNVLVEAAKSHIYNSLKNQSITQEQFIDSFEKNRVSDFSQWTENGIIEKVKSKFSLFSINLIGEGGIGKTETALTVANFLKIPLYVYNPSQWVDNADIQGMPEKLERNGRKLTINALPEKFPLHKLVNGEVVHRKDGGKMVDFEGTKDYIKNYDLLMEYYNGDINQAPGYIVFFDELNRVVAEDVKQALFQVFIEHRLENYVFPDGGFFLAASNPNTSDYNVSNMFEERAFRDRFVHVFVENNVAGFTKYAIAEHFDDSIIEMVNSHNSALQSTGEAYDLDTLGVMPSPRSWRMINTIVSHTHMREALEEEIFVEVLAGVIGLEWAGLYNKTLKEGSTKLPTAEEIITNYPKVRGKVVKAVENLERQDIVNQLKDDFMEAIVKVENIEAYDFKGNLENIHGFLSDLLPEYRVEIVKSIIKVKEIHPIIARHLPLYEMIKEDIHNSKSKKAIEA